MLVNEITPVDVSTLIQMGLIAPNQSFDTRRDITLVARAKSGNLMGCICLRPMFYTHSFHTVNQSRFTANALWGAGIDLARRIGLHGTLFQVHESNEKMRQYVEGRGAITEPHSVLYRYDVLTNRGALTNVPTQ